MAKNGQRNGKNLPCDYCGKIFYAFPGRIKKYGKLYCSQKCKQLGYRFSVEQRMQMRNSHFGQATWNKGLTKEVDSRLGTCGGPKGKIPWNKGLTKETNSSMRKASERLQMIYSFKPKQVSPRKGKKLVDMLDKNIYEEFIEKVREKRLKQIFPRVSSIEKTLYYSLKQKNLEPKTQYPLKVTQIDIAFPEKKLAIYCDGDYWHANPRKYNLKDLNVAQSRNIKNDEKNIKFLTENGWKILRFWEYDINNDLENCVNKIVEEMK